MVVMVVRVMTKMQLTAPTMNESLFLDLYGDEGDDGDGGGGDDEDDDDNH